MFRKFLLGQLVLNHGRVPFCVDTYKNGRNAAFPGLFLYQRIQKRTQSGSFAYVFVSADTKTDSECRD